ncbi:transcription antitermination factor NusB [Altibacter sp. HG106]|uniref:transcription antitermination factor NusB n=1 Tax=Altibacter sp. HG106 TaxID=3023937 RepID=UPI00235028B6|nr:transcription antitermination factor NusB [Altibacter sp. HG106]MDC7996262.1 transcription antitermination factor NusB [Altibacter sp. HG106]
MLTRRHIRVKVLQSIYALRQNEHPDLEKQEKFLFYSIDQMQDLYVLMLQLVVSLQAYGERYMERVQQKHLATKEEKNPSRNFINNQVITLLSESESLQQYLKNKKLDYWKEDDEYLSILFSEMKETDWYAAYLLKTEPTYEDDKEFVVQLYKKVIAPNDKLYDYLEDKRLTWLDDFPWVNTAIVKMLSKITPKKARQQLLPDLYKNEDDREFARQLFRKTVLNDGVLSEAIEGKTPNWDTDRIADIDLIILKLGIAEFLYFPSIPVRASLNEYLEISKEYSTPKSSLFINGILDKLVKEFTKNGKLKKIGRGLR